jgi:GNAT superfamily N-acetyltransferase
MEVDEAHRRKGLGSYLVQELKRIAREGGHTPAARCNSDNIPSRLALERAGMLPCARILRGRIDA